MSSRLHAPLRAALLVIAGALTFTRPAAAYKNGIQTTTCGVCHRNNGTASTVTLTGSPMPAQPGDLVNFVATITAPNVKDGGIFVLATDTGTLGASATAGLTLSDGSLTHSTPKAAADGAVTFDFTWQAPSEPGAVKIQIYALAGNGNVQNSGDLPGETSLEFTYGCEPGTFYFDADADGHGGMTTLTMLGCAGGPPPRAYAPTNDDCDEAYATVYPGAPERCNGKDDNCDGNIDENTAPTTLYPDPDGDGFYGAEPGDGVIGCLPLEGYADEPGDCAPSEPGRHPRAEEVCNLKDDDCDGHIDEDVRPRCGVGRCAVEAATCEPADCHAGTPTTEKCNGLDDDCNGIADDSDTLCPEGLQCLGLRCVAVDDGSGTSAGTGASAGMTSATTGGTGAGGASTNAATGGTGSGAVPAAPPDPGDGASTSALQPAHPTGCGVATGRGSLGALVAGLLVASTLRRRRLTSTRLTSTRK